MAFSLVLSEDFLKNTREKTGRVKLEKSNMPKILSVGAVLLFLLFGYFVGKTFGTFLTYLFGAAGIGFFGSLLVVYVLLRRLNLSGTAFLQKLHRRIKLAVVVFLCGANGFFVSAALIGQSTCDCCEREHPNAVHTYPLLDSNETVSKIWRNTEVFATLAVFLLLLNIASMGLTALSMLYGTLYACAVVLSVAEKFKTSALLRK